MICNRFIVFEGPHESGKTTQAKLLKNYLDEHSISSVYTKEPYLGDLKKIIDKYSFIDDEISSYMLLYLHAADRFAHIKYIKKELENSNVVIADRYLLRAVYISKFKEYH
ncbi:Thymidylate kinase [subsurface metagenome]